MLPTKAYRELPNIIDSLVAVTPFDIEHERTRRTLVYSTGGHAVGYSTDRADLEASVAEAAESVGRNHEGYKARARLGLPALIRIAEDGLDAPNLVDRIILGSQATRLVRKIVEISISTVVTGERLGEELLSEQIADHAESYQKLTPFLDRKTRREIGRHLTAAAQAD